MARLTFHVTMGLVVGLSVVVTLSRHLGRFAIPTPPEHRTLVAVFYNSAEDRLTFRRPEGETPIDPVIRLDVPEGFRLDGESDRLWIGPEGWSASQCLILALSGGPPGIRIAKAEGEPAEAAQDTPGGPSGSRRPGGPEPQAPGVEPPGGPDSPGGADG